MIELTVEHRAPRAAAPRIVRRALHGVLLLDKPPGLSSNDALQKARRLFRAEKAGHTGTLDPLATGLLPLCFGAATKFSQFSLDADKHYRATIKLGITTTTADAEGQVLQRAEVNVTRAQLQAACAALCGEIDQVPPMYSALKRDGKPLYAYARAGVNVEREARRVTIHRIAIVARPADTEADTPVDARSDTPAPGEQDAWTLDVHCSKGTYIRTLAEDIGRRLGCGAHLAGLRRTGSGALTVQHAYTLEQLAAADETQRDACLLPADALLADWPLVRLHEEDAGRFLSGVRRRLPLPDMPRVRVYGPQPGAFLGSGQVAGGELISTRLLSPTEVQGLLDCNAPPAQAAPQKAIS